MSRTWSFCFLSLLLCVVGGHGAESRRGPSVRDIEFARVDGQSLKLDLHLTVHGNARAPLIVWVHGGAWRSGSRESMPLDKLVEDGCAVASVDYRLSTQAKFPAQIH